MLPGFRFLFAAIMLSMSLLIFGLGAAALFRAAHESVASNSSWRATPDVPFAQRPETTLPMLATLRVEPMTARAIDTPKAAPAEPTPPAIAEPMTSDQVAALRPVEAPQELAKSEFAKTETAKTGIAKPADTPAPAAEIPPAPETTAAAPVGFEAAETKDKSNDRTDETKTAAVASFKAASIKSEPAVTQPAAAAPPAIIPPTVSSAESTVPAVQAAPPAASATDIAMTKIATLGGPPVEITDSDLVLEPRAVKIPRARPDESVIKKRQQARRAAHRRRLAAARARLLALQQLQANPFAQPQTFPPATPRQ